MSSQSSTSTHAIHWSPRFDELRWVVQIRRTLDEEYDGDEDIEVSIFNVPKPLLQAKPEAFVPQLIALGPYHHWRPEMYEMEKYKLSAARRVQRQLPGVQFQQLVDDFSKQEIRIRGSYHKYLDLKSETLAWMMAMDACFLLEFLQVYAKVEDGRDLRRISSKMSHLVDVAGKKSGHNTILRDTMMMENQIPLFLLRKVVEFQYPLSSSKADQVVVDMLKGFVQEVCPLKLENDFSAIDVFQKSHLLGLLYHVLMPKEMDLGQCHASEIQEEGESEEPTKTGGTQKHGLHGETDHVWRFGRKVWKFVLVSNTAAVRLLKKTAFSRPVRLLALLPWKLLTIIPGFSFLNDPAKLFFSEGKGQGSGSDKESAGNANKQPLVEEIMIPSVEELVHSGVRFEQTDGGLTSIAFDPKTAVFRLPIINLDVNSEVVLRNLVAYETSVAPGPLVLTRYTELMNGIIDTEEDVRLLRRKKIVLNHMKSDGMVAELLNGMSRSVRLTKVPFIDKVIEDVNRYHNSRWKVKTKRFMKKYVFGSWPFLTFLAAILLLLLTSLQAFCSVYSCARWLNVPVVAVEQS